MPGQATFRQRVVFLGEKAACLGLVWLLFSLGACATKSPSTFEELGRDANTRGFGRRFPHDPHENAFVFGVGDQVVLVVQESIPIFSGTYPVGQDGKITVPLINDVLAGGLTAEQLRKKLESRIRMFMRDPQMTVVPGAVVSRKYFVAGVNPATGGILMTSLPYQGDTTLLDAFVQMGAPSTILDSDTHVRVIRGDPRHPRVMVVNVREIFTEGYTGGNIQLQPDDIVYVPPTFIGKINVLVAGISIPFTNLFRIVTTIDTFRIIFGNGGSSRFSRGRAF